MELISTGKVHLASAGRYLRVAAIAILTTGGLLAGQVYLDLGALLAGWMTSAQPVFMTLGVSGVMKNPGFGTGMKIMIGRLARAVIC
ncbi:hypothetical protein [Methanocella sp. MCL-LM]|uniref:hypothetical protein n=1 Tax=Methanocella sp. MCL-LM TaxID=3412035 RepID=UPI003C76728E